MADQLQEKEVNLKVIDQSIDTGGAIRRLLFSMLGAIAQFKTEIRAERQMDSISNAKARGVHMGRKKYLVEQECAELREKRQQGALIKTLMHEYKLSKASVYRYLEGTKVLES